MAKSLPMPADVADAFSAFPSAARKRLLELRTLVFRVAASDERIGPLTETLKWGEPSYLAEKTKSGSTLRMGWKAVSPDKVFLFFNCNTTLVESFREAFGDALEFEGNRALALPTTGALPRAEIQSCIHDTLTYHLRRR